ncbi:hypothetical protein K474DRAFT_478122 [Panus rudis PR-1116 ss-1]|nr:hypothetical protein K474DRAFT_478122 [Panus rudis PR-1116 ss-1]
MSLDFSARLPQELVNEIIQYSSHDTDTLDSLQYVSKACLDTVRVYTLEKCTLIIRTNRSYDIFLEKLTGQYAHLAKYIADLTIAGAEDYDPDLDIENEIEVESPSLPLLSTRILPCSLLRLLPRLTSLTVKRVHLVQEDVAKILPTTVDVPFHDSEHPIIFSLRKLSIDNVAMSRPIDTTLTALFYRFRCTELVLEDVVQDIISLDDLVQVKPIALSAPILHPIHLTIDETTTKTSFVELLARLTAVNRLASLQVTDVDRDGIRDLGAYFTAAHSSLTHLDIRIQGIKFTGNDPWEPLNLSAFTNLRSLTVRIPIIGSSTSRMGFIWKAFSEFLRYLPTTTITSIDIILEPDHSFLGSTMGILGRMPDEVKNVLDDQFTRFLPVLKHCEVVWIYRSGLLGFGDGYLEYSPMGYLNDLISLLPSLCKAGILDVRTISLPLPDPPYYANSVYSNDADQDLLYDEGIYEYEDSSDDDLTYWHFSPPFD